MAKTKTTKKTSLKAKEKEVPVDRRLKSERRTPTDRRKDTIKIEADRRVTGGRRKKVARRRQIDPTTCERDYTADEVEFMHALDAYKRAAGRMFPTCSEILEVVRDLGYRRLTPEELAKIQPPPVEAEEGANAENQDETAQGFADHESLEDSLELSEDSLEDFEG